MTLDAAIDYFWRLAISYVVGLIFVDYLKRRRAERKAEAKRLRDEERAMRDRG